MKYILYMFMFVLASCSIVGQGERGVRLIGGRASTEILQPGAHLWFPVLYGIENLDVQVQKSQVEAPASTKDLQEVHTTVAVNWSIDPSHVYEIYSRVGDESVFYDRIINPAVNEIMKSVTAQHTAEEVLTQRLQLKKAIDTMLASRLNAYGINVTDVNIVNFTFDPAFMKAVEAKQIAEQQAKQASFDAEKATQLAKATVNKARGDAEAQALLQRTLTHDVLTLRYLERWDGHLSVVSGSGNSSFLLDVSRLQPTSSTK